MPTNEGRGYVLRRLIRRAARHGRLLGIDGLFLAKLSGTVIAGSKDGYPELEEKQEFILKVLTNEETQFNKTIDQGLRILAEMEEELSRSGNKTLDGGAVFKLYDTYGFPVDLTKEILEEKGHAIDEAGFKAEMEAQRKRARESREVTNYMGADATVYDLVDASLTTEFVGYDSLTASSKVAVLAGETELAGELLEGQRGTVFTAETPFYATMGGQEGDTGVIAGPSGTFRVEETIKLRGGKVGHVGVMESGMLSVGETVTLTVESASRQATCKNHSATHLLQKALRTVLGSHVEQKGSLVTPGRLRFDFAHFQAMTAEELAQVEALVNAQIAADLPVVTDVMSIDEAKKAGAMALFGEKYDQKVRVVSMGDFSKELCGGTHVSHTGAITLFKLVSESGIAAGVRRIEALTGDNVLAYYRRLEERFAHITGLMKAKDSEVEDKIAHLLAENKALAAENESLKNKLAQSEMGDVMSQVQEIAGVKVLATRVPSVDAAGLRELGDQLRDKIGEGVVVLVTTTEDKVSILATATAGAVAKGAHAGNIVRTIAAVCDGKGGGRPDSAMAGGKDVSKADAVVAAVADTVAGMFK